KSQGFAAVTVSSLGTANTWTWGRRLARAGSVVTMLNSTALPSITRFTRTEEELLPHHETTTTFSAEKSTWLSIASRLGTSANPVASASSSAVLISVSLSVGPSRPGTASFRPFRSNSPTTRTEPDNTGTARGTTDA